MLSTFRTEGGREFTVEMDETTNMPVVPEGHYWRVAQDSWGDFRVELRRQKRLGCVVSGFLKESTPEDISFRSAYLWDERTARNRAWTEAKAFANKYVGDYPPKEAR